jgi:hypothetical protein
MASACSSNFNRFRRSSSHSKAINLANLAGDNGLVKSSANVRYKNSHKRFVATPLRTGGARWAARDHPTRGAFLLQLRVPVLKLWLSHLQQRNTDFLHPAVQNLIHPPFHTRTYECNGFCHSTLING